MAWLQNLEHSRSARPKPQRKKHMGQLTFAASLKLNLERQQKILAEKQEQLQDILDLIETTPKVVEFAELMQKFQQQPGQPEQ